MPVLTKINTNSIADDAVTSAKIPTDALGATDIAANAVTVAELADNAVDTNAILDDAVTGAKLANDIAISTTGAITTTGAFTSIGIDDNADAVAITIDSDENVCIGTTSVLNDFGSGRNSLVIKGSGSGDYSTLQMGNGATSSNDQYHGLLAFYDNTTEVARISSQRASNGSDAYLKLFTAPSGGGVVERMRIASDGTIGLGGAPGSGSGYISTGEASRVLFVATNSRKLELGTENSTRMTIDTSGNVGMGEGYTSGTNGFMFYRSSDAMFSRDNTALRQQIGFANPNGTVGSIQTSGSSTSFNTSSDYRLKENVVAMSGSIDRLKTLKPSRFNFIVDADKTVDGFLAHEAQAVVPESVTGEKDGMRTEEYEVTPAVEEVRDEDGNITTEAVPAVMGEREVPDMQGIDQSKLVPLLVGALQEAITRIETLENA